jgi:hypothetical protein
MKHHRLTVGGLSVLALAFGNSVPRAQTTFTSAIDVTGWKLQLHTVAPDRDTQKPVDVPLPTGLLGPKMNRLFATPLSAQIDQYWNSRDPKTGKTPRQDACDGKPGKDGINQTVAKEVAKIGKSYGAYDIKCELASTGQLLVKQAGSTMQLAYQLTNNTVSFAATSPLTCKAGHGTPLCPNDPRFTVHFATQIVTVLRAPGLCQIVAEQGTVYVVGASIHADNGAADIAKLLKGDKFIAAEVAITQTVRDQPLPIDDSLQELRTSGPCTGKTPSASRILTAFREFETVIDPRNRAIVMRATHVGIQAPQVFTPDPNTPAPFPAVPSFTGPQIFPNPLATAGKDLTVTGKNFPRNINVATAMPVSMDHNGYPGSSQSVCSGGWTDLDWGPVGRTRVQQLRGDAQGRCPKDFSATGLTPNTAYQFRARDCDVVTCSPWSAVRPVTTAKVDPNWGKVALSLAGHRFFRPLGTGTIDANGNFTASMHIPEWTTSGRHTVLAVNRLNAEARPASATANIQVTAAPTSSPGTNVSQGTMLMVFPQPGRTDCISGNPIISSTVAPDTFLLTGSGFSPGPLTVHLDSQTGDVLGTATADPNGGFCQKMNAPAKAGKYALVAVANNVVVSRLENIQFVIPSGDPR